MKTGTPILYEDQCNHRLGYIVEAVEAPAHMFTLGTGKMLPITSNARVVWLNDKGEPVSVDECMGSVLEKALSRAAERSYCEPVDAETVADYVKRAEIHQANAARERHRRSAEAAKARAAFKAEAAKIIPGWAKAAIVASYDIDDCDPMTDYFNVKTGRTILLGFSKHTRDLFAEMRKHCGHCSEADVRAFAEAPPKDDYGRRKDEHREKWSMGKGYYLKNGNGYSSGWKVKKLRFWRDEDKADSLPTDCEFELPTKAQPKAAGEVSRAHGYRIEEHVHTKRGFTMFLVIPAERVERAEFERLRDAAKAAGGWYSRQWRSTPGGFAFKEKPAAEQFAAENFGPGDNPGPERPHNPRSQPEQGHSIGEKLRTLADNMQPAIDNKLGDRLENTPKRQREGMAARIEGDRLQRTQQALYALADKHDAGDLPALLAGFTTKAAVYKALGTRTDSQGYYHIADTGEPTDTSPEAAALWQLIDDVPADEKRRREIADKVRSLQFADIPGYFRTPADIVARMLDHAQISVAHRVLEPSAGDGAIIDAIVDGRDPNADDVPVIVAYERNHSLCEVLRLKGFDVPPSDFLDAEPVPRFDRVLMNPPFENLQDIDHVRHAFAFLREGGRLVAIMSPGPFFRDTAKARDFRDWFDERGGEAHDIEAGAFKESGTGVAAKLVVIDRND